MCFVLLRKCSLANAKDRISKALFQFNSCALTPEEATLVGAANANELIEEKIPSLLIRNKLDVTVEHKGSAISFEADLVIFRQRRICCIQPLHHA